MTADDRDDVDSPAPESPAAGDGAVESGAQCWNCGAALPEGAMFCGECGSAVGSRAARPPEEPEGVDAAENLEAIPVEDPEESGLPPHGDALLETAVDDAEVPPGRVPDAVAPEHSPDEDESDADESGLPPHGDALLDPDAPSAWSLEGPGDEPAAKDGDEAESTENDSAEDDSADDPAEDDSADDGADSAPTAVQAVVDDADGLSPHGDPVAPGAGPGFATESLEPTDDDGDDPLAPLTAEERFAAERLLDPESEADKYVLQFSTGESATVYGSGLVGRNPVAEPGEYVDHLVVIRDPGRSVSKTHLEFGQDRGSFWVLDRFSGNGSALREPGGTPKRCEPGRRYVVARGTRIEIGDQFFVVS